ncbi:TlpA disulfide reductase family protein [Nannocystis sp. RBIL2]|uniref:TlpA family protein disulfide reductase n=1 Tax=Nannocystis sp. RBIL2 TaxID=2996788 RepID=UPI00227199C3|nr:TlpA disulfide reductase family protein [Nannocystis sp. RBIL2]MCY1064442.1 TlpA disulfide reductase family protein [Nannocystis sp. RBIL2]
MIDHHESGHLERGALPIDSSRIALGVGALAALFTGITLWALWGWEDEVSLPPEEPRLAVSQSVPDTVTAPESAGPAAQAPVPGDRALQGRLMKPREVGPLLAEEFQFRSSDGKLGFARLRSALGGERMVSILNVWAPWCEPCKREFPGFRALQDAWGPRVRFLPIQLGEGDSSELRAIMPSAPYHLIDYVLGGAVQRNLVALDLLSKDAQIPITLVLDCKDKLRWLHVGEVHDMEGFDRVIKSLTEESSTPYCAAPRPVEPAEKSQSSQERCGNGRCETLEGTEDCDTCPKDCGCRPGRLCSRQAGGRHLCIDEVE